MGATVKGYFDRRNKFEAALSKKLGSVVLEHPFLKRLDKVSFLGVLDHVLDIPRPLRYTRYEHTLGVAYLTMRYCRRLGIQEPTTLMAILSALSHDIGHGPFSHSLERLLARRTGREHGHHSTAAITKIAALISDCYADLPNQLTVEYELDTLVESVYALVKYGKAADKDVGRMFGNPFCPDTFDGTNRACHTLGAVFGLATIDPVELTDEVSSYGEALVVGFQRNNHSAHPIKRFHSLMKELYEKVIYSPRTIAAEAMLVKATSYAWRDRAKFRYSKLTDNGVIRQLSTNRISHELWNKIRLDQLYAPLSSTNRGKYETGLKIYQQNLKAHGSNPPKVIEDTERQIAEKFDVRPEDVIVYIYTPLIWDDDNIFFKSGLFLANDTRKWTIKWAPSEGAPLRKQINKVEIFIPDAK